MLKSVSANHYQVHGHIDMQADSVLLNELMNLPQAAAQDQGDLVLDVSAIESADSLLLAALLDMQRKLALRNANLTVTGLSDSMLGLARVYGIDNLLKNMLLKNTVEAGQ